jgi:hypothetical protein
MSSYGTKGTRTPNNRFQRTAAEPERSLAWRRAAVAELNDAVHELIEALCAESDTFAKKAKYPAALKKYWAAWDLLPGPTQSHAGLKCTKRTALSRRRNRRFP